MLAAVRVVAAFALGFFAAFVTTGPALFSDGPFYQRIWALGIGVVAFAVLGAAAGALSPGRWRRFALWLWAGSVPVAAGFAPEEIGNISFILLTVAFLVGDLAAVLFGAWFAARARARRSSV
jgi:hypothetical protein